MKRQKPLFITILVLGLMGMASSLAIAENFVAIYGGVAIPLDENVNVTGSSGGVALTTSEQVSFDDSFTVGGRLGYWHTETNPSMDFVGVALDVSYFKTKADDFDTDIYVVPITVLIMLRYQGETFQPYLGIGGGAFISDVKQDVDLSFFGLGTKTVSDTSIDPGLDVRAGLAVKVYKNIRIFGESRYTYFEAGYRDTVSGVRIKVNTDSDIFYFLGGLSYYF